MSQTASQTISQISSVTFDVDKVLGPDNLLPECKTHESVKALIDSDIESCCDYSDDVVKNVVFHPVVAAALLAYLDHRPLVFSPDIVWLTIAQGLANHINQNSEKLRHQFVDHQGKEELVVRRNDFIKGTPENDWPGVFNQFSSQIHEHIGKKHDLICSDFSTTGPVEQAASELVLMDAMQSYFDYTVMTICGIPQITLEGSTSDWQNILERACQLTQFGLEWWTDHLIPVCTEFVNASEGNVNKDFWSNTFKQQGGSGGPFISGWITHLFPYVRDYRKGLQRNTAWRGLGFGGLVSRDFPGGASKVPFKWLYYGEEFPMEFIGGFVGVKQGQSTLALKPKIGWAVRDAK